MILARYKPIEFLGRVAQGRAIRQGPQAGPGAVYWRPSPEQRIAACKFLADKVLPSLLASEMSGPGGAPLIPKSALDVDAFKAGVAALLRAARE